MERKEAIYYISKYIENSDCLSCIQCTNAPYSNRILGTRGGTMTSSPHFTCIRRYLHTTCFLKRSATCSMLMAVEIKYNKMCRYEIEILVFSSNVRHVRRKLTPLYSV